MWALYFDNFPHGHYGTIRQQIWSLLHFPFQLSIVGIVEGGQQLVLARYVIKNWEKISTAIGEACRDRHEDGEVLRDSLLKMLNYWDFGGKYETQSIQAELLVSIYEIGNETGICSPESVAQYHAADEAPEVFSQLLLQMFDGVYIGLGMKLPMDKLEKFTASGIAIQSWQLVYLYFWISFSLFIICTVVFLVLIRRHRTDMFDFVSIGVRLLVLAVGGGLIAFVGDETILYNFLSSPAVLLTCLALLFVILFFDRLSAAYCNRRLKRSGEPYAEEYTEEHSHAGHVHVDGHAEHASGVAHHDSGNLDHRKSAAWSLNSDTEPLNRGSGYYDPPQSYAMSPLMSNPVVSPPPMEGGHVHRAGGYAPVGHDYHGA